MCWQLVRALKQLSTRVKIKLNQLQKDDDVVQVAFMKDIIEDKKEDVIKDREVIEDQIYVQNK